MIVRIILMDQPRHLYKAQKHTNSFQPTTQSGPDLQTDPHQARNT